MQITDTITCQSTAVEHGYDIADAIRDWFPEAPAETHQAIKDLQAAAMRGEDTLELEAALAIEITR